MNERIKQLKIQACKWASENVTSTEYESAADKKFAELIVAECIEVCRRGRYDSREDLSLIQFNNGIRFCINAIDEHFGD